VRYHNGFTLTELLVTLLITSLLSLALFNVMASASRMQRTHDQVAELRERARFALDTIEPDIQMAGAYGLSARGADFRWLQAGNAAAAIAAALLAQNAAPLATAPSAAHECGVNFVLELATAIQADNNRFQLGRNRSSACAANGGARLGADTLTVRRASGEVATPTAGRIQLLVDRSDERKRWIAADGVTPAGLTIATDLLEWHDLQLSSYYISNNSVGATGIPALRVKALTRVGGQPAIVDNELMSGVEDLQVQLHTDSGVFNPEALPAGATVRMVQVWLRLRAGTAETGFRDLETYRYADVNATMGASERAFRRLLVTRRYTLRNALP
jgi:type IV pilus assembly protein PilW